MLRIKVRLTALLAVKAGHTQLELTLSPNSTLATLIQSLEAEFGPFGVPVYFLVNGKTVKDHAFALTDGCEVTVLMATGMP